MELLGLQMVLRVVGLVSVLMSSVTFLVEAVLHLYPIQWLLEVQVQVQLAMVF